jgi:hypothetical protein
MAMAPDGNDLSHCSGAEQRSLQQHTWRPFDEEIGNGHVLRTRWHAVCDFLEVMTNTQSHTREPVGLETDPMARTRELTLLDVIQAVSDVAENDQEIIATVVHLINSGQVRLSDEAIEAANHLMASLGAVA